MDLFVHENRSYAQGLKAAGVTCELYLVPRAPHAFDLLVPDASISRAWFEAYCEFLRKWLQL